MKKIALTTLAITAAAFALSATPSFARGTCKDVYINAQNNTGKRIKVIDINYYISGYGTKSEPTRNEEVPAGRSWSTTRNLERAGGRATTIIVKYRKAKSGFTKWTKVYKATSRSTVCHSNGSYSVVLR